MSGSHITIIDATGSTNADLAGAIRAGAASEGEWLVARRQTAGRGRQGREWFDGSGNFMGSVVVDLREGDPPPASLSFVAGLAVYHAVSDVLAQSARPVLKWPNDVMINGAKLAGILLEMVRGRIVVGIGVNLAKAPVLDDRATAALADFGAAPEVSDFANLLAQRFADQVAQWREGGLAGTLNAFEGCAMHRTGAVISVHDTDGSRIEGSYLGLDPGDGALRLSLADGSERVIRAGDIV